MGGKELTSAPGTAREGGLRAYRAPWKGQLVLACGKCQKKLRRSGSELAKLKKLLKVTARRDAEGIPLHVLQVPCLKLCPKGGVAVCTQAQIGQGSCSIVWTHGDVETLYAECKGEVSAPRG